MGLALLTESEISEKMTLLKNMYLVLLELVCRAISSDTWSNLEDLSDCDCTFKVELVHKYNCVYGRARMNILNWR